MQMFYRGGARMKLYVGVTDKDWFDLLKESNCDEVNFWKPGTSNFKMLQPNDLFLFKLHSPYNYIVGGGFFVRFSILPTYLAWDSFGIKNGTRTLEDFNARIRKYRQRNGIVGSNPSIGCIILTEPFFFDDRFLWKPRIVADYQLAVMFNCRVIQHFVHVGFYEIICINPSYIVSCSKG